MPKRRKSKSKGMHSAPLELPGGNPLLAFEQMMKEAIAEQFGIEIGPPSGSPAEKAQELVFRAFESRPSQQVHLARQALDLDPDCAEAHLLLGENATTVDDALGHYQAAVAAGRRALGERFDEMVGEMWMYLEARPYLRARMNVAQTLYAAGRHAEAADEYREMLRLNPNDNQGVRELLLALLFELRQDQEAERLLDEFRSDSTASWIYGRALLAFRAEGDSPKSRRALAAARKANKHLPAYLLGDKPLPEEMPDYFGIGDTNEAVACAAVFLPAWKGTPGAISWLRDVVDPVKPRKAGKNAARRIAVPEATSEQLLALPQDVDTVWQADVRRMPMWIDEGGRRVRPWLTVVANDENGTIVGHDLSVNLPDAAAWWQRVSRSMLKPFAGNEKKRPGVVQVCRSEAFQALKSRLEEIGVRCETRDDLPLVDIVFQQLVKARGDNEQQPALLDVPGMEDRHLESFYESAAAFYRLTPWRKIPGDTILEITLHGTPDCKRYAVVMGQSGIELGFALYDDRKFLQEMLKGNLSDREMARRNASMSVMFGEDFFLAALDVDAIERNSWPVGGPEGYPWAIRISPGMKTSLPTVDEFLLLDASMRSISAFLCDGQTSVELSLDDEPRTVSIRRID